MGLSKEEEPKSFYYLWMANLYNNVTLSVNHKNDLKRMLYVKSKE